MRWPLTVSRLYWDKRHTRLRALELFVWRRRGVAGPGYYRVFTTECLRLRRVV